MDSLSFLHFINLRHWTAHWSGNKEKTWLPYPFLQHRGHWILDFPIYFPITSYQEKAYQRFWERHIEMEVWGVGAWSNALRDRGFEVQSFRFRRTCAYQNCLSINHLHFFTFFFHKTLLFPHIYLTNNDYPQLSQERDAFPLSGPPKWLLTTWA